MFKKLALISVVILTTTINNHALGAQGDLDCTPGVYANGGGFITLTTSTNGYAIVDEAGKYYKLNNESIAGKCNKGLIIHKGLNFRKLELKTIDTVFSSKNVNLAGQLILAKGANEQTPLVVYAHGSESLGWIGSAIEPYQLLARGISVFVFDKRGTGKSEGKYNQNIPLLAHDVANAVSHAQKLAAGQFGKLGIVGLSQGGWVAPLASIEAKVDFVVVGYGLATTIAEEDADQVTLQLRHAGFNGQAIEVGKKITAITARMAKSSYVDGTDELTVLKKAYQSEPWFKFIRGGYTGVLIDTDPNTLLTRGIPMYDALDIDWSHDPMQVLRSVNVPQLWLLAEEDTEAPIERTLSRLMQLKREGVKISIGILPNSNHGMWLTSDDNQIAPGYFDTIVQFVSENSTIVY